MEEARILLPFRPVAGVHAPGLKVAAVGDAAYFPICLLAWEPDFQVKGLARAKAHIAGAQQHSPVGKLKRLQNPLCGGQHFLVLYFGLLGRAYSDEFDLLELMLTDKTPRVPPRRSCFRTETGGEGRKSQGQRKVRNNLLAHQIGEADLRRRAKPETIRGAEQNVREFGKLPSAEQDRKSTRLNSNH